MCEFAEVRLMWAAPRTTHTTPSLTVLVVELRKMSQFTVRHLGQTQTTTTRPQAEYTADSAKHGKHITENKNRIHMNSHDPSAPPTTATLNRQYTSHALPPPDTDTWLKL